jgi:hypothetical protein
MKKSILLVALLFVTVLGFSQSDTLKFSADLTNNFIWRGIQVSPVAQVQPLVTYSKTTKNSLNYEIGAWSSFGLDGSYKEVDVYGKVSASVFSLMVTDYMLNTDDIFNYSDSTMNIVELSLGLNLNKFAISLNTNLWGFDKHADGTQLYSTYVEASYRVKNVLLFAGVTTGESLYSDDFGVVNSGVSLFKDINIGEFTLPVKTSFIVNPDKEAAYANVAFTF